MLNPVYAGTGSAAITVEQFFSDASDELRARILQEQIALVKSYQGWFQQNDVMVTINVDEATLHTLNDDFIADCVKTIGCLHFEVSEFSSTLVKRNPAIEALGDKYSFWLDDFGAGYAGFGALAMQSFRFIKMDKKSAVEPAGKEKRAAVDGLAAALLQRQPLSGDR